MTSTVGAHFDKAVNGALDAYRKLTDRHGAAVVPLATLGACLGVYALSRPLDKRQLPTVTRAPKLVDTPPYPKSIYGNTGRYLETPYGRIRYYDVGPKDGKKLLLVHGISTPVVVWQKIVDSLVASGFRLLMFDLWGRGYSDSPALPHDIALYVTQLTLLLAANPEWDRFHMMGLSLGGPITANFCHYFPDRVDRVILCCPAGATPASQVSMAGKLASSPFFPPQLLKLAGATGVAPIPLPTDKTTIQGWQLASSNAFFNSFVSSLRYGPLYGNTDVLQDVVTKFGSRIQAIWGDADTIVPMETSKHIKGLKVQVIPGAGHYHVISHPDQTLDIIKSFLK